MKEYPVNTRFNPTTNGTLHIGHLYMILVNEHTAHNARDGGQFIVRFDDNQLYWRDKVGERVYDIESSIREDIEWMKVPVDKWISQLDIESTVAYELERLMEGIPAPVLRGKYFHDEIPETKKTFVYYPYTAYYTLEKVWMDFSEGINTLIRGEDLITEFCLYSYFVDLLGLPRVRHVYLPRLCAEDGEIVNLSKTAGNFKIAALRAMGITPEEILDVLQLSCLKVYGRGFDIDNIKEEPILDIKPIANKLRQAARRV